MECKCTETSMSVIKGDLRPVAVGHMFLRLIGSMAPKKLAPDIQSFFLPAQLGVGVRSGCELMFNAVNAHLKLNPSHILISADVANAFNT